MTVFGAKRKLACEVVGFRFAPIPGIRGTLIEPRESTPSGRWAR